MCLDAPARPPLNDTGSSDRVFGLSEGLRARMLTRDDALRGQKVVLPSAKSVTSS
jgi:hypothetical protein